jgi:uncharacterized protein (DUF427 family)
VYIEPYRRRLRGVLGGRTVIDSQDALLVHRPTMPWYGFVFPNDDVEEMVAGKPEPEAPGYVRVRWDAVDQWFEEDEPVLGYAKNPYHRVDCLRTSRRLRVDVAGTTIVDSDQTVAVFETALEPKLYVPKFEVRMDLLVPSATTTFCGYKGSASYWNAVVDGTVVEDVAWSYEDVLSRSGCEPIRGRLTFDEARASVIHDFPPA